MNDRRIDELPDEILTEITNYFIEQNTVFNFLLINKEINRFMIDSDGRIKDHYGYCCSNVRFGIKEKKYLKNVNNHFMKRVIVECYGIDNEDVKEYLLGIYDLYIDHLGLINDRMKCFENSKINYFRTYSTRLIDDDLVYLKNLKCLDIKYCCKNITDDSLKHLSHLEKLYLRNNQKITDKGIKYLENVHTLQITICYNITNEGLKYLKKIHALDISFNKNITDVGLSYLPNSICTLNIEGCKKITDSGMKYLKNIHKLYIPKQITDVGLKYFSKIHTLIAYDNKNITDVGIGYISNAKVYRRRIHFFV